MARLWRPVVLLCILTLSAGATMAWAADWPGFRGPNGDGHSPEQRVAIQWGPDQNIQWKVPLPRPANGSPIVANGRVLVTSAEDEEGKRRSLYCFDRRDGSQLWVRTVEFGTVMPTHETNPYCGSTPACDAERVVVWHGSAGLFCYDLQGQELWSRNLGEFRHMWGYGTSPVIYRGKVILHCGPGQRILVVALDLKSGQTLWQAEEPHEGTADARADGKYKGSWTTPIITNVDGSDQVICAMPTRLVAYDPESGDILWTCDGIRHEKGDLAYSSPVVAGELCFATAGFNGPALAVRLGGRGDVTESHRVWRTQRSPQSIGSAVYVDGFIYRPNVGPGTIDCIDPKSGELLWRDRAAGGDLWGSIVYAAGHCYVTNQQGVTAVFKPNPHQCQLVASNALGEPSNSTPAISDGQIFIRTSKHLYCIAEL